MRSDPITLITDSTCDIPANLLEEYSIQVVHHVVIWNGKEYRDRVNLQPEDFYHRLGSEKALPTTSQASVQDFTSVYQTAYEHGSKEVVVMLLSGALSGAIQSAQQAAENSPIPVHVYDSHSVTMGLGWQVLAAARSYAAGGSAAEMLEAADRVRRNMCLYIYMDTLEYVYRGGRIGNARRLVGAMLNIKPLVQVDHDTGVVEPVGKALSHHKGLDLLYKSFIADLDVLRPFRAAVLHGNAFQDARTLLDRIQNEYNPVELLTNITCPVLGIHTGPGAIGLCGYFE